MNQRLEAMKKYFIYFMFYSIVGWLYEVFLEVVVYRWGFSNRGVLLGCWCPIYGTGALILVFALGKLRKRKLRISKVPITPVLVFLGIVIITTLLELLGSYIMEWQTGSWMWDYSTYFMNFQGRIALNTSIRFGIGGMVMLYVMQPAFEAFTAKCSRKTVNVVFLVLLAAFLLDVVYTFFIK